jgi:hypothetical protein
MNILQRLKITDGENSICIDGEKEVEFDVLNCEQIYCFSNSFDLSENLNILLDSNSSFNLMGNDYDFNCNFLCKINNLYCDKFEMDSINETTKNTNYSLLFLGTLPNVGWINGSFNFKTYTNIGFYQTSVSITTSKTAKILKKSYNYIAVDNICTLTTIFDNIFLLKSYVGELYLN